MARKAKVVDESSKRAKKPAARKSDRARPSQPGETKQSDVVPDEPGRQMLQALISQESACHELRSRLLALRHDSDQTAAELQTAYGALEASNTTLQVSLKAKLAVEEKLQEKNSFLETVLGMAEALVIVLDRRARILQFNAACERAAGYSLEELKGQPVWGLIPKEERAATRSVFRKVVTRQQDPTHWENDWMRKDGSRIRIMWSSSAVLDATGEVQYVIATGLDITERLKMEQSLRDSEARTRALLGAAAQAVFAVDRGGQISFLNSAAETMFGYGPGELIGEHLERLIPSRYREIHVKHHSTYFAAPSSRPMGEGMELVALRRDGTEFSVEVSLGSFETAQGPNAVAIVSDITERRRIEIQREKDHQEMRRLTGRLLTAQEDEARRFARELHDGLTQELVALSVGLNAALGNASSPPIEQRESLEQLAELARSLAERARHISHGIHPSVLEHLGLAGALRSLCREFSGYTGVRATVTASKALPRIPHAQRACVYRIVQEALWNTAKHSGSKQVSVRVRYKDGILTTTVSDKGKGFDPIAVRSEAGLGLVGMEERARLAGGELSIRSEPGRGTAVKVSMRVAESKDTTQPPVD